MIALQNNNEIIFYFERSYREGEWELHLGAFDENGFMIALSNETSEDLLLDTNDVKKVVKKLQSVASSILPIPKSLYFPVNAKDPFAQIKLVPKGEEVKITLSTRADKIASKSSRPEDAYCYSPEKKFESDFIIKKKELLNFCDDLKLAIVSNEKSEKELFKTFISQFSDIENPNTFEPGTKKARELLFNKEWQSSLELHNKKYNTSGISTAKQILEIRLIADKSVFLSYESGALFFTTFLYHIHDLPIENKFDYFHSFIKQEYTLELHLQKKYSLPYHILTPDFYDNPNIPERFKKEHSEEERAEAKENWLKCSFNIIENTQKTYDAWEAKDTKVMKELKETFGVTISLFFMFFYCWVKGLKKDEKSIEWLIKNLDDETINYIYKDEIEYQERIKKEWEFERQYEANKKND